MSLLSAGDRKPPPFQTLMSQQPSIKFPLRTLHAKGQQIHQLLWGDRTAKRFSHVSHYLAPQAIAGYIGFLGHQNLGDEILYESFKHLFKGFQFLPFDGATRPIHNPPFNYYPVELALYRSLVKRKPFYDVVFLGGGTLINREHYLSRFQYALFQSNKCIVFGTGVCEPNFWHQFDQREDYLNLMQQWIPVLANAAVVKVRGPLSAQILEEHGLARPDFISDPALAICQPRSLPFLPTGTIGVNIGCHGVMWGNQQRVYETIKVVVQYLTCMGWKVELLPFEKGDVKLCDRLIQELDCIELSIWKHFTQIDQTLKRIQSYDLVIGQRLHSIVLACGSGVPFIALKYAPKCDDFIDSINFQEFSVRTDEIDVDIVLALVNQIYQNYDSLCKSLVEVGNHYRSLQHHAARQIMHLVDH